MSGVLGVLQARCSSSRLPGKVLLPVLGEPMLARQIERLKRAKRLQRLIVATSRDPSDDALVALCESLGVACFRGSLDDVLDRFYRAAAPWQPETVVRLTGDCPLADPALLDRMLMAFEAAPCDYLSNALEPTFPDGLDIEIFRFACLEAAWREAEQPAQREHVTLFINRQPERFRIIHFKESPDLSALRWTVDEPADYALVCRIYEALYPRKPDFGTADILAWLAEHPENTTINTQHVRNEGLAKSLAAAAGKQENHGV